MRSIEVKCEYERQTSRILAKDSASTRILMGTYSRAKISSLYMGV